MHERPSTSKNLSRVKGDSSIALRMKVTMSRPKTARIINAQTPRSATTKRVLMKNGPGHKKTASQASLPETEHL